MMSVKKIFNNLHKSRIMEDNTTETIINMFKEDYAKGDYTKEDYKRIILNMDVRDLLKYVKKVDTINFTKNNFAIKDIILRNESLFIYIKDYYCPIAKDRHDDPSGYFQYTENSKLCYYCHNKKCIYDCCPNHSIHIPLIHLNCYFKVTNNITNIVENYDDKFITSKTLNYIIDENIFSDDRMNYLLINSLNDLSSIVDTIYYIFDNIFHIIFNKNWYKFIENKWYVIAIENIQNIITEDFKKFYNEIRLFVDDNYKIDYEDIKCVFNKIDKIRQKLTYGKDRDKIIKELIIKYKVKNYTFDKNLELLGFNNGNFNLKENKLKINLKDDLILMNIGYNYNENYSENKEDLLDFLKEILPNTEIREYFLSYLSKVFLGINKYEFLTVLAGSGNDGRNELIDLISLTFGDYYSKFSQAVLKKSYDKKEELINKLDNKKIILFDNGTDNIDNLDLNLIKNIVETNNSYFPFLLLNDISNLLHLSFELKNSIIYIHFSTNYKNNAKDKLKLWSNDFMLLLLEYKNKELIINENVLKIPKIIINDKIKKFVKDCTKSIENEHIPSAELCDFYVNWFKLNFPDEIPQSNRYIVNEFKNYYEYSNMFRIKGRKDPTSGFKNIRVNL